MSCGQRTTSRVGMLAETDRSRQLKPKEAMTVPLEELEGWQPPSDWTVQR